MEILHIGTSNKFTIQHFEFIKEKLGLEGHFLLSRRDDLPWPMPLREYYMRAKGLRWISEFVRRARLADRIILHGLLNQNVLLLLLFQPSLLTKCYWIIWGADLYAYTRGARKGLRWRLKEWMRRRVLRNVGHLVTYVQGDADLARKWYDARGAYHECLMYPSNLYKEISLPPKLGATLNIQVGNSADLGNHHEEVLRRLQQFKNENIRIFAPLSYGNKRNAECISRLGSEVFLDKFVAMRDFLSPSEYLDFLSKIDIAIFNHDRQQAMGNIITLLGLGKTVYMRDEITSRSYFKGLGIEIMSIVDLGVRLISEEGANKNKAIVRALFSEARLAAQLKNLYSDESLQK